MAADSERPPQGDKPPADRAFHERRWMREALTWAPYKKARQGLVGVGERHKREKRIKEWGIKDEEVTPEDVMRAEAELMNERFDIEQTAEYRQWGERMREMARDFKEARDHGKPEDMKVVSVKLGTGTMSVYGAAQDVALRDMGFDDLVDVTIGSSGASGPALYAAAGTPEYGASMFMNEVSKDEFIARKKATLGGGMPLRLDTGVIARAMRSGPKAVNQDAIRRSGKEVYAVGVNTRTKKAELIDFNALPDMIVGCEASSAIPLFREAVEIGGQRYYDGAFAAFPFEEVIERFKPTHLIIQPNAPFRLMKQLQYLGPEKFALWLTSTLTKRYGSLGTPAGSLGADVASIGPLESVSHLITSIEEFIRMKENSKELIAKLEQTHHVKIAILWPPDEDMGSLINDADTLRRAVLEAYRKTVDDFGEPQPERVALYPGDIPETEDAPRKNAA